MDGTSNVFDVLLLLHTIPENELLPHVKDVNPHVHCISSLLVCSLCCKNDDADYFFRDSLNLYFI